MTLTAKSQVKEVLNETTNEDNHITTAEQTLPSNCEGNREIPNNNRINKMPIIEKQP